MKQRSGPRSMKGRTVFVSGCFDALHPGHVEFLEFARAQGDKLIVSVAADGSIRELKGREPVYGQNERIRMIQALRCVDLVVRAQGVGLDDCFPSVCGIGPSVWVVNDDDANIREKALLASDLGVELVYNRRPAGQPWSTTGVIARIRERPDLSEVGARR